MKIFFSISVGQIVLFDFRSSLANFRMNFYKMTKPSYVCTCTLKKGRKKTWKSNRLNKRYKVMEHVFPLGHTGFFIFSLFLSSLLLVRFFLINIYQLVRKEPNPFPVLQSIQHNQKSKLVFRHSAINARKRKTTQF